MNVQQPRFGATRRFALELGHEIRLPLASLRTGTDLLAELSHETELPADWSRVVRMVQRGSERLGDVADNLFAIVDLVDVLTGHRQARATPVRVGELVTHAEFRLSRRAPSPANRIVNRADGELWECEPTHMARAVYNVMSVAVSRSHAGRDVTVESVADDAGNSVTVLDGGPRVEPERWDALVDVSLPNGEGSEGHALALMVARPSTEANGGSMGFENTPAGVRWRLTLPAR